MKVDIYYTDALPAPDFEEWDGKMVAGDIDDTSLGYRLVWSGSDRELDFDYTNDEEVVEAVFDYFNRKKPDDFVGQFRSISIGDVVCLENRCYACQTVGWRELEKFESNLDRSNE